VKLLGRTTQPEDVAQCLHILRDRFLYTEDELQQLSTLWVGLLSRDIARSAVFYSETEPRRILAFGISAPLKKSRFDELLRERAAFITKTLLTEWTLGREPFLDEREYAYANASDGLNVFVLHNGVSDVLSASEFPSVLLRLSENFVTQYAGCRLQAVAHEAYGVPAEFAIDHGLQLIGYAQEHQRQLLVCPADRMPSLGVMSREHAAQHPGHLTMNMLFLRFAQPRFSFNVAERRLLRFAIEGESDLRIADLLQIAPRTLKKRWAQIYFTMETVTGIPSGGFGGHRGAEARRHVLRYIRQHPEELHAYSTVESTGRQP
jgi:DNA-binding CsgD family transcriptional regulator